MDYSNLNYRNIDTFFPIEVRKQKIENWIKLDFNGKVLDVGCGHMPYKEKILNNDKVNSYTGVDIESTTYQVKIKPDFFWDGKKLPFTEETFDIILLTEVLEHVPDIKLVLVEIKRVLNASGKLFITVPFLWGLHDIPNDEYRYTPFALERILLENGFEIIELEPAGRWNASLASMLGQYIRRHLTGRKRTILSYIFLPIIKQLYKTDSKDVHQGYKHGEIITGLHCVVKKLNKYVK